VAIGLAVGWLMAEARRRIQDPVTEIVLSVVTGYAAYLLADRLGLSAVLAAVTAGLYVGWRAPELASPSTRLLGFSFGRCWSTCSTPSCSSWSACSSTPSSPASAGARPRSCSARRWPSAPW
jgi:hypothetical protein